jgi:hypothetical protein
MRLVLRFRWVVAATLAGVLFHSLAMVAGAHADEAFRNAGYPWHLAPAAVERLAALGSTSPQSALNRLEQSHRDLDLEAYAALLTADYRFITAEPRIRGKYPDGFDRRSEISAAAGLFGRAPVPGQAPVTSIDLDLGLVSEGADPDHPDSLDHYRLIVAPTPAMTIRAANDGFMTLSRGLHAFYLVRGDAAVLPEGAPALPDRWSVRRWVETPETQMAEAGAADAAAVPDPLKLVKNPAAGPFEIDLAVPEAGRYQIEVFDVAGRRSIARVSETLRAGGSRLELRDTGKLPAGIYWISLSREGRSLATRVATRL